MILKFKKEENRKIYFTSDLHFCHKNILSYDNRPYDTIEEMNRDIVETWNNIVSENDIIFLLGDITLYEKSNTVLSLLKELKGDIYFIQGNHDTDKAVNFYVENKVFKKVCSPLQVIEYSLDNTDEGKFTFQLCHYPMLDWRKKQKGGFQIFGHTHGNLKDHDVAQIEISWPVWYRPIEIDEILVYLTKQQQSLKTHYHFND